MDAATLAAVMGNSLPLARYEAYVGPFNEALIDAQCTTVNRAAMFVAQIGEESGGLMWTEELASGEEYEGRASLGNSEPGDGVRFKGRGILQVTGRAHYGEFSRWCHDQGLVDSATYFVDNPAALAELPWSFLSASWYWTSARATLNAAADAGNVELATRLVNGGENGLPDRTARWERALGFGTALLPSEEDELTPEEHTWLSDLHDRVCRLEQAWPGGVTDSNNTPYDMRLLANRQNVEQRQTWIAVQDLSAKIDELVTAVKPQPVPVTVTNTTKAA